LDAIEIHCDPGTKRVYVLESTGDLHALDQRLVTIAGAHEAIFVSRKGNRLTTVDESPDIDFAVVGFGDGTIKTFPWASPKQELSTKAHFVEVSGVAVSPDGKHIVGTSVNGVVTFSEILRNSVADEKSEPAQHE
jgi:hypothetical protein